MSGKLLTYSLWLCGPLLQVLVLIFMVKRKLRTEFPMFFTYTLFQILSVAVLFTVYHSAPDAYFHAYWVSATLGILLGFAVLHEVFSYAIKPYVGLRDLGNKLFRWAAFLLLLVGSLVAVSSSGMSAKGVILAIVNVERTVRLMQCGLLLFVVVHSSYLGLTWKNFVCGIALGFGLFAASDLVLYSLRAQLGGNWNNTLSLITSLVYNLSVLTWLGYSMMPATASKRVFSDGIYRPLFDRWNQAAIAMSTVPTSDIKGHAYLSELERTVENVMMQAVPASSKMTH